MRGQRHPRTAGEKTKYTLLCAVKYLLCAVKYLTYINRAGKKYSLLLFLDFLETPVENSHLICKCFANFLGIHIMIVVETELGGSVCTTCGIDRHLLASGPRSSVEHLCTNTPCVWDYLNMQHLEFHPHVLCRNLSKLDNH